LTHHFWGESTNRNHIMHGEILASVILSSVDSHLTCYCRWQKNNLLAMTGGGWADWRSFAAATRWEISCCLNFVHHTEGRCICLRNFCLPGATIRYLAAAGSSDAWGRAGAHSLCVLCVIISALLLHFISANCFVSSHLTTPVTVLVLIELSIAWLWCLLWRILAMQSTQFKFGFQAASLLLFLFTRTQSN